jgi:hypothetical protein
VISRPSYSRLNSRFFELSEFTDQLDFDEKERLLRRWEGELADFQVLLLVVHYGGHTALILPTNLYGQNLGGVTIIRSCTCVEEWLNWDDEVILF